MSLDEQILCFYSSPAKRRALTSFTLVLGRPAGGRSRGNLAFQLFQICIEVG